MLWDETRGKVTGLVLLAPSSSPLLNRALWQLCPGRANYPFPQAVLDKSDSLSSESSTREIHANAVCGLRGRQGLSAAGGGGKGGQTHNRLPETPFSRCRNPSPLLWGCSRANSPPIRCFRTPLVRKGKVRAGQGQRRFPTAWPDLLIPANPQCLTRSRHSFSKSWWDLYPGSLR